MSTVTLETTERRYGAHLAYKGSTSNRHNEVRCWKPVLSRVGMAALRAELQHRLNCDPKDLEFLPDILFNRGFAQTLNQELCAAVLAQTGVTRHPLACFDAPQHPDSGPEAPVVLDTRTSLSLCILALLSPPVSFLSHLRKVLVFFTPATKRGVLFLLSPGAVSCSMGSGREVEVPALAREPLLDSFLAACSASREVLAACSTCR